MKSEIPALVLKRTTNTMLSDNKTTACICPTVITKKVAPTATDNVETLSLHISQVEKFGRYDDPRPTKLLLVPRECHRNAAPSRTHRPRLSARLSSRAISSSSRHCSRRRADRSGRLGRMQWWHAGGEASHASSNRDTHAVRDGDVDGDGECDGDEDEDGVNEQDGEEGDEEEENGKKSEDDVLPCRRIPRRGRSVASYSCFARGA